MEAFLSADRGPGRLWRCSLSKPLTTDCSDKIATLKLAPIVALGLLYVIGDNAWVCLAANQPT